MKSTNENTPKNNIRRHDKGAEVTLDPEWLLKHALYMPDGETIVKSNMTLGQAIEAIAYAHIKAKLPHLEEKCIAAKIEFINGKFVVNFMNNLEDINF